MANATEDVFGVLQQAHGQPLSVAQIFEQLGGAHEMDDVHPALEHLRDEGVAVEDADGHWALRAG